MIDFTLLNLATDNPDIVSSVFGVLISYVLSSVIAFTYIKTFLGLSYSRAYVHAMILGSVVVCCAMQAIGDNLARGLGMMGALSIIRFRTNLKEPRDMIFLFATLAVGIAAGVHSYNVATVLTVGFCLVAFALYASPFSQNLLYDGMLRFTMVNAPANAKALETVLTSHCQRFSLVTLRESQQGQTLDYAYQIKLRRKATSDGLVAELARIESVKGVSFLLQSATLEV